MADDKQAHAETPNYFKGWHPSMVPPWPEDAFLEQNEEDGGESHDLDPKYFAHARACVNALAIAGLGWNNVFSASDVRRALAAADIAPDALPGFVDTAKELARETLADWALAYETTFLAWRELMRVKERGSSWHAKFLNAVTVLDGFVDAVGKRIPLPEWLDRFAAWEAQQK